MSPTREYKGMVYLLAVVVVLPLLAWRMAFADTVGKWRETRRTEKQLAAMRVQTVSPTKTATVSIVENIRDGELLSGILCGPGCCEVVKYTPYAVPATDGLTLHTAEVVLDTDFHSFVRIVDNIERTMPASRLRSLTLRTVTPRGSHQARLYGLIIIQQITETK